MIYGTASAQFTIATDYVGATFLAGPAQVTFTVKNNNTGSIVMTGVSTQMESTNVNAVYELYYSATSLSGSSTNVTTAPWTLISTSSPVTATGIARVAIPFPGLNFIIPAGTTYRFALRIVSGGSIYYSGTTATVNTYTVNNVEVGVGTYQIGGVNVGYAGSGTGITLTPRSYAGTLTFQDLGPCTNPPTPGTISASSATVCMNTPFTLSLTGGTACLLYTSPSPRD